MFCWGPEIGPIVSFFGLKKFYYISGSSMKNVIEPTSFKKFNMGPVDLT